VLPTAYDVEETREVRVLSVLSLNPLPPDVPGWVDCELIVYVKQHQTIQPFVLLNLTIQHSNILLF
jgi:hypothetical protein